MARAPLQMSDAQKPEVESLAAVLTTEQIADFVGIGRRTFYDLMARDEEIAARYKKGKARAIGAVAQTLISKARAGDTTSMIFYLKTQAGWRETAGLALSVAQGQEQDSDAAFQVFVNHLDEMAERLAHATAHVQPTMIVDAEAAPAVELPR